MDPLQNPPAIYGEVVAGRAAHVRKQLMIMSEDIKERTFDMAELLYEAKHEGYLRQWGYASVGDYGEVELGIKYRKAQYLTRIVEVMKAVNFERKDYEPVGVTKLREITRLEPSGTWFNGETLEPLSDHIKRLVKESPALTTSKIAEEVNKLLGMTGKDSTVIRSYATTQDAWDKVIKPGMEIIRRKYGDAGRDDEGRAKDIPDGKCIEMAFAEVIADPNNDMPADLVVEADTEAITQGDIPMEEPTI